MAPNRPSPDCDQLGHDLLRAAVDRRWRRAELWLAKMPVAIAPQVPPAVDTEDVERVVDAEVP